MQERVRTALVTRVQSLAAWGLPRVLELIPQARLRQLLLELRARVAPERLPAPAQRFGRNLWQRIVARFPSLAGLVVEADPMAPAPARAYAVQQPTVAGQGAQLAAIEMGADVHELIAALRDPSAEHAAASAVLLGRRDEPEAKAALLDVLRNADGYFNPLVRVAALQTLAHAPERSAGEGLSPLFDALRDVDAEVSMAAIEAVATHAPADIAMERLLPIVLDDTGFFLPVVRAVASRALERAGLMATTTLSS
jgi:hypothetical protein